MSDSKVNSTKDEKQQSSSSSSAAGLDSVYDYDENYVNSLRKDRPWDNNPKFFQNVKVSALASMKMLKHALSGVEKGRKAGTNPIEIMGLMIGKPVGNSIVIMDACPLPVQGSETRVVADDAQIYMLELMESLELRRKEGFIGWYHSHPFDVETYSHCHLSAIDVQTQLAWQNASPMWTAIVIDPLRSLAKQEPEFGAFRAYSPKYNPPANELPDGTIETDQTTRVTRWGMTYSRYYSLPISYFMSGLGNNLLDIMSKNNLWVRILSSSSIMETENRQRFAERIKKANDKLSSVDTSQSAMIGFSGGGMMGPSAGGRHRSRGGGGGHGNIPNKLTDDLSKGSQACSELAIEMCKGHCSQLSKDLIFNLIKKMQQKQEQMNINSSNNNNQKQEEKPCSNIPC